MSEDTSVPVDILNKLFMVPKDLAEQTDPTTISFFPQTEGWLWLFGLLGLVALVCALKYWQKHQRDLWRRDALALLDRMQSNSEAESLPVLIKRVLLVHTARAELSSVSGTTWLEQLNRISSELGINSDIVDFVNGPARHLADIAYRPAGSIPSEELTALFAMVRQWIKELPHV